MTVAAGAHLNHYEIITRLGAGGMGEVWLAEDQRLRRKVALKLLPAEFTRQAARVRRFEQEARAASALNHPNIITIFEIGEVDGAHFIATEFIDGQTLRTRLEEKLAINAALDIAVQMASALAAAHEAGITHRDIKPENVMLRRDGIVKVLDFGLAKLTEQRPDAVDSEAPTIAKVNTDPGTVMGTASYMSPEQARGQEVDARSDIFSLGVVLYEMIAGRPPFAGLNALDVIGAILNREPAPLGDVPPELQRIVSKALRKDRDERYQHVKDLLLDLKDLKQELDFKARQERSLQPGAQAQTAQAAAAQANQQTAARTTSSAEIIIGEIKRHKRGLALALAAFVVLIAGVSFGLYKLLGSNQANPAAPSQTLKFTRLTAHGQATAAAVSPDGKYVVYAKREAGGQSLWLRQLATNSDVQIVPPGETRYFNLSFSRDGNFIYFVARAPSDRRAFLYQMTALGRNPRRLETSPAFSYTFSPDSQRMAFLTQQADGKYALALASAEAKDERVLATSQGNNDFVRTVAWSPDGQSIACVVRQRGNQLPFTVVAVNVEGGAVKPLTAQRWTGIDQIRWLTDGSGLIVQDFDGREDPQASVRQLWYLAYPSGEARRLTNDLNTYSGLSLTADGSALVTLQQEPDFNIWVVPGGATARARQLPRTSKVDGINGLTWTPDGKLIYNSNVNGKRDIWMMEADGGNPRSLEVGEGELPIVSADGRWLFFGSRRTGHNHIWRAELSNSRLTELTNGAFDRGPTPAHDGQWVVYSAENTDNNYVLMKAPLAGGALAQLSGPRSVGSAISPDGKLLAFFRQEGQEPMRIVVIPFEGGPPVKTFDPSPGAIDEWGLRWTPDGRTLTYIKSGLDAANVWGQPLAGGPPKPLTDFKSEAIRAFDWSRDGRLAVTRGVINSDVVLITGLK